MKRAMMLLICAWVAMAAPAKASDAPADSIAAAIGEKDVADLATLWEGWFDNFEYTQWQEARGIPAEAQEGRRLKIFKRVDVPALGKHVTYVEQYLGDPPESLFRQRLYHHWWDAKTREIVTDIYAMTPADEKRVLGAHLDPAKLNGLRKETMTNIPAGCEVRWRKIGDHFVGVQKAETCSYIPPGTNLTEPVRLSDTITLDENFLTTTTQFRKQDAELWNGNPLGLHDEGRKARIFNCELKAPDNQWRDLTVYDQGGWARVETKAAPTQTYVIDLRRLKHPYVAPEPDALVLRVVGEASDGDRTLIESRAPFDATAIKGDAAGVAVSCLMVK